MENDALCTGHIHFCDVVENPGFSGVSVVGGEGLEPPTLSV